MTVTVIPTKTNPVFNSKIENYLLFRVHEVTEHFAGGAKQQKRPSLSYQFEGGVLTVTDELRDRDRQYFDEHRDAIPGHLDESPAEDWLRNHEKFNTAEAIGGFWEIHPAAPDSSERLQEITRLALDRDLDGLTALWQDENGDDGWKRDDVNESLLTAIETLREAQAAAE